MNESTNNERLNYEAPETTRTQVVLENTILKASGEKQSKAEIEAEGHTYGGTIDNSNEAWDN